MVSRFFEKIAMSTQLEEISFDESYFQQSLAPLYRSTLIQIHRMTKSYLWICVCPLILLFIELIFFFSFLPLFVHSAFLALTLTAILFTGVSYCILLFYFQAKKPEQFEQVKKQLIGSFRKVIPLEEAQHHLSIAAAFNTLASYLEQAPPLVPLLSIFARWEARDRLRLRIRFLNAALEEQLKQLHITPTDLEVHISLANTYIALSKLFHSTGEEKIAQRSSQLALEEFQILNDYAPNDPWIHEQLAQGYRDLGKFQEELKEVETLVLLRPQDSDLLLRLGALYFEQGMNAKGLRIYEGLKQTHYKKAEELIISYGNRKWLESD